MILEKHNDLIYELIDKKSQHLLNLFGAEVIIFIDETLEVLSEYTDDREKIFVLEEKLFQFVAMYTCNLIASHIDNFYKRSKSVKKEIIDENVIIFKNKLIEAINNFVDLVINDTDKKESKH